MNPPENGSNKLEQNGRAERAQIPKLVRGFAEASGGFPVFHILYGHNKENGNV